MIAPFSGVITARLVDVGSLVAADATSGSPLLSIDRTDVLRVQIYVPQDAFFGLKDGNAAEVTVPELPGRVFHGTVARNASSLLQQTRTLLTEVDVDNADGTLDGRACMALCTSTGTASPARRAGTDTVTSGDLR